MRALWQAWKVRYKKDAFYGDRPKQVGAWPAAILLCRRTLQDACAAVLPGAPCCRGALLPCYCSA